MTSPREQLTKLQGEIAKLPKENQPALNTIFEILTALTARVEKLESGKSQEEKAADKEEKAEKASRVTVSSSTFTALPTSSDLPEITDITVLQGWTGKMSYRMLYDSSRDGLIPAAFNTTTSSVTNMMTIIITTDSHIFGTFNSFAVPPPPVNSDTAYIEKDPNYFVFTLKNPHNIQPTKFGRKKISTTLRISPSDGDAVMGASDCFSIFTTNSYFIPTFGSYYLDSTGKGADLFVGSHYPTRFVVKRMYAIQWV
ncbi:hypothetical protein EIN_086850 [Entamoeba invadens IP1]|uniref:hypothetical protein n=1 Tax=Entamoeba invadens IP1 TaxID=370355 RepID=UPI0002C3F4A1|nr:hypothetical protein EIN_086850 [Entamoeba invadens IP1]ELP85403.1 hypothetical protein EIN_086850 [Entamoeba invadens IP1]|eukprot:XP_004184749.1 hypothetical protein EIN_086850 [Entamoeba invadens IP1]